MTTKKTYPRFLIRRRHYLWEVHLINGPCMKPSPYTFVMSTRYYSSATSWINRWCSLERAESRERWLKDMRDNADKIRDVRISMGVADYKRPAWAGEALF